MNIIKTLKSSISEKGNYCYSLPVETTKEIIKDVEQLQQENKQLKDNWNKLKKFIKSQNDGGILGDLMIISDALNKMEELEKSDK